MTLYEHIADGLRRNVPDALARYLAERIDIAEGLASGTKTDQYQALAQQLQEMCA